MKCEHCQNIIQIEKFSSYLQYASTKSSIDSLVDRKIFEISDKNPFEVIYHCRKCGANWALGIPDFPITGCLVQR